MMCKVVTYVSPSKINDTFRIMLELAEQSPDALAVVATLKDRVAQLQAQRAADAAAAQASLSAPPLTLALPAQDNPLAGSS